jgi:hypothetical protein
MSRPLSARGHPPRSAETVPRRSALVNLPTRTMRPIGLLSLLLLLLATSWALALAAPPPDPRLEQKLSLAVNATALSDLCARLQTVTHSLGVPSARRGQQIMWNGVQSGLRAVPK